MLVLFRNISLLSVLADPMILKNEVDEYSDKVDNVTRLNASEIFSTNEVNAIHILDKSGSQVKKLPYLSVLDSLLENRGNDEGNHQLNQIKSVKLPVTNQDILIKEEKMIPDITKEELVVIDGESYDGINDVDPLGEISGKEVNDSVTAVYEKYVKQLEDLRLDKKMNQPEMTDIDKAISLSCSKCNKSCEKVIFQNEPERCFCHECKAPVKYHCKLCKRNFNKLPVVRLHLTRKCIKKDYKCSYCSDRLYNDQFLRKHILFMHPKVKPEDYYKCNKCSVSLKDYSSLRRHLRDTCGVSTKINCTICSFTCKYKFALRKHMLACHKDAMDLQNDFSCTKCGNVYERWSNYQRHLKYGCWQKKTFFCAHCKQNYLSRGSLRKHLVKKHSEIYL